VATVTGIAAQNLVRNGITVTDAIGVQIQPALADVGSATVSNVYGVYVKNPVNVTPANVYALYTEALTSGMNNYGVYVTGDNKSYFGGNVGIGTTSPAERLHVIGNIRASGSITAFLGPEMDVPDYVFEPGYKLMSIEALEEYIAREKHLPNVPKAGEIKEKGLNLSEFQMKLLEKIEELTLYTVQQAKTISQKDAEVAALKSQNEALDARLVALEQIMERLTKNESRKQN
jgi:hypothetical protein